MHTHRGKDLGLVLISNTFEDMRIERKSAHAHACAYRDVPGSLDTHVVGDFIILMMHITLEWNLDLCLDCPGDNRGGLQLITKSNFCIRSLNSSFARRGFARGDPLLGWHAGPLRRSAEKPRMKSVVHPNGQSRRSIGRRG